MNVTGTSTFYPRGGEARPEPLPWTAPFPAEDGWKVRWLSGNICHPELWSYKPHGPEADALAAGETPAKEPGWFNGNPGLLFRFFVSSVRLPFISFKRGRFGFYAGFKVYGVDAPEYLDWLPAQDVFPGSYAVHFSIRFSGSR